MSEEEKKAIEDLIKEIIILKENSNKIIDSKELLNYKETLLKLITRQKQELEKEKEIIKNAICFLKYYNKDFNKMSDNEIKQILYNFGKCADIKKEE